LTCFRVDISKKIRGVKKPLFFVWRAAANVILGLDPRI
jgi:hypothetical protein